MPRSHIHGKQLNVRLSLYITYLQISHILAHVHTHIQRYDVYTCISALHSMHIHATPLIFHISGTTNERQIRMYIAIKYYIRLSISTTECTTFDRDVSTFYYLAVKKLRNQSRGIIIRIYNLQSNTFFFSYYQNSLFIDLNKEIYLKIKKESIH